MQREQVHNIKDALQFISHPHSVEITAPTRPGVVIEASRQELIESLPPVLVLHLKRFLYDTNVGDVVKIGKQVSFSPELEFGPGMFLQDFSQTTWLTYSIYLDLISPARKTAQPVKYQLFGGEYSLLSFLFTPLTSLVSRLPPWTISIRRPLHPRRTAP